MPWFLLAAAPAASLTAQVGVEEPRVRLERSVEERVAEMRKLMREGKVFHSNVRVQVWLRNGNKLTGIVKGGKVVERVDGLRFIEADLDTPGAGVRVWYFDGTDSYIWLPFESIRRYKVGERLTDVQLREMVEKLAAEKRRREQRRQQTVANRNARLSAAERAAAEKEKAEFEARKAAEETAKREELTGQELKLKALLDKFPTSAWSAERRTEIERRKVTVGAFPSDTEKEFLESYALWQQAVLWHKAREARKAAEQELADQKKARGGSDAQPAKPGGK